MMTRMRTCVACCLLTCTTLLSTCALERSTSNDASADFDQFYQVHGADLVLGAPVGEPIIIDELLSVRCYAGGCLQRQRDRRAHHSRATARGNATSAAARTADYRHIRTAISRNRPLHSEWVSPLFRTSRRRPIFWVSARTRQSTQRQSTRTTFRASDTNLGRFSAIRTFRPYGIGRPHNLRESDWRNQE